LRDRLFSTYVRTMLIRRRSAQHSSRQTLRRLAFLAAQMRDESQTVFTLELLDEYAVPGVVYRFGYRSPTRSTTGICGLASGLMLGVAGMLAYDWPGGLTGAVIGFAVELPSLQPINSWEFRYQRTSHRELQWTARRPRYRLLDIPDNGFKSLLQTPVSLRLAAGGGALAGVLLGWSGGLFASVVYGVATAVTMLTAVTLCLGYSYRILREQPVEPRDGSGEIPSPIARAVLQSGLFATPVVTLVTPIVPGLLVAWMGTAADGVRFAALAAVGAAIFSLSWLGGFGVVEQAMVRRELRKQDLAPLPLRPFLD